METENTQTNAADVKFGAAEKTKKALWALPGALATIGGIVGLYQFVLSPTHSVSIAERTQTELLEMVSSGKMTPKEAQAFAQTLKDLNSAELPENALPVKAEGTPADITKTAAELAASEDPKKRMAIVLLADKQTREDGIVMLEGTAKTSDDWLDVAELSWGWDNDRTLEAARKAVTLNPSNYEALSLLASAQIANNEFKEARKTAMAIMVVAETDAEKITAYSTLSHPQQALGDLEGLKDTAENLTEILARHKDNNTFKPNDYSEKTLKDSPSYAQFDGYMHLGSVNFILGEYEAALAAFDKALIYGDPLAKAIPENSDMGFQLVRAHQVIASTYYRLENLPKGLEEMKLALEIVKNMSERGAPRSREYLPQAYGGVASLQIFLEDFEGAQMTYKKMGDLLLAENGLDPDSEDDWMAYVNARMGEAHALTKLGQKDEGEAIVKAFVKQAQSNLISSPETLWKYHGLSQTSWYAGYYYRERGEIDKAMTAIASPPEFVKSIEMNDENRENIENMTLTATVSQADIYVQEGDKKKAEAIYLDTLRTLEDEYDTDTDPKKSNLRIGVLYQRLSALDLEDSKIHADRAFEIYDNLNSEAKLPLDYQESYMTMLKERQP